MDVRDKRYSIQRCFWNLAKDLLRNLWDKCLRDKGR